MGSLDGTLFLGSIPDPRRTLPESTTNALSKVVIVDTGRAEGGGVMQTLPLPVSLPVIAAAHLFLTTSVPTLKAKRMGRKNHDLGETV
jgi:hypothetical protein